MAMAPTKPQSNAAPATSAEGDQSQYVEDGQPNVSPEEQAQYDQFMGNAMQLIYGEDSQVRPEVLQALQAPPTDQQQQQEQAMNPAIMALAQAAVTIVTRLDDSAREQNQPITDDVLIHGSIAVIEELGEIAEAAKIHDYSEEDLTGAFQLAVDMYRPKAIADGRTSEETLKGQFAELNDADAAGKLGDVLPGLGGTTMGEPPVQPE